MGHQEVGDVQHSVLVGDVVSAVDDEDRLIGSRQEVEPADVALSKGFGGRSEPEPESESVADARFLHLTVDAHHNVLFENAS